MVLVVVLCTTCKVPVEVVVTMVVIVVLVVVLCKTYKVPAEVEVVVVVLCMTYEVVVEVGVVVLWDICMLVAGVGVGRAAVVGVSSMGRRSTVVMAVEENNMGRPCDQCFSEAAYFCELYYYSLKI